jgi:hypothetical protein
VIKTNNKTKKYEICNDCGHTFDYFSLDSEQLKMIQKGEQFEVHCPACKSEDIRYANSKKVRSTARAFYHSIVPETVEDLTAKKLKLEIEVLEKQKSQIEIFENLKPKHGWDSILSTPYHSCDSIFKNSSDNNSIKKLFDDQRRAENRPRQVWDYTNNTFVSDYNDHNRFLDAARKGQLRVDKSLL